MPKRRRNKRQIPGTHTWFNFQEVSYELPLLRKTKIKDMRRKRTKNLLRVVT